MRTPEAHIAGIGTALPFPVSTERALELDEKIRKHLGQPEVIISLLQNFVLGTGIRLRHSVHPMWLPEGKTADDYPEIKHLVLDKDIFTPHNYVPPYWERMAVFEDTAIKLGVESAKRAIANWGGNPKDITHIITTCTSGWSEPGLASATIHALDLSLDCQKAELNFNGCFCGATCLRLARDCIRAGDAKAVLVVAVEVATTHYDPTATDISTLVATSLFADGAAAIVLSSEGKWRYQQTGMSLVPDSMHLLGLKPPHQSNQNCYQMFLHKTVGQRLGEYFRDGHGKDLLTKLYPDPSQPRPALAIHPGGPNILDNISNVLQERGWAKEDLQSSYDSLQTLGNLGAAAMLFVLAKRLNNVEEDRVITLAFGPGVTVEWASLQKVVV